MPDNLPLYFFTELMSAVRHFLPQSHSVGLVFFVAVDHQQNQNVKRQRPVDLHQH